MIRYVDHVGITVQDLERSIAFYAKLDFSVVRTMTTATHKVAFVRNGLAELELFAPKTGVSEPAHPLHEDDVQHIAFHVDDIDGAVATLEERGVTFTSTVRRTGKRAGILFKDPDGTLLQLLQG
jgi:catechol 2,3-dioxygenase-like lactoylglutathione lyase family enzyme